MRHCPHLGCVRRRRDSLMSILGCPTSWEVTVTYSSPCLSISWDYLKVVKLTYCVATEAFSLTLKTAQSIERYRPPLSTWIFRERGAVAELVGAAQPVRRSCRAAGQEEHSASFLHSQSCLGLSDSRSDKWHMDLIGSLSLLITEYGNVLGCPRVIPLGTQRKWGEWCSWLEKSILDSNICHDSLSPWELHPTLNESWS